MLLHDFLKERQITDVHFAKIMGISPGTLLNYKKRNFRPSFHIVEKIVRFSKGKVSFADMGFTKDGIKLPYRKEEIDK